MGQLMRRMNAPACALLTAIMLTGCGRADPATVTASTASTAVTVGDAVTVTAADAAPAADALAAVFDAALYAAAASELARDAVYALDNLPSGGGCRPAEAALAAADALAAAIDDGAAPADAFAVADDAIDEACPSPRWRGPGPSAVDVAISPGAAIRAIRLAALALYDASRAATLSDELWMAR